MSKLNQNIELNKIAISDTTINTNTKNANKLNKNKKFHKIFKSIKNVFSSTQAALLLIISNETINKIILFFITFLSSWILAFILFGYNALPGSMIFSLFVLISTAHAIGYLFRLIKLPELFGMILVGIFFQNVPVMSVVGKNIDRYTSSFLRSIAFCVILCRAGFRLKLNTLNLLKWNILKLSLLPSSIEMLAITVSSYLILKIPILWSFLLGFVMCAISPDVIVPLMIEIDEKNLGRSKNISKLLISSSCFDNVLALTCHGIIFGILYDKSELAWAITKYPIQVLIGISCGIVIGCFLGVINTDHMVKLTTIRFFLLLIFGMIILVGSKRLSFTNSGSIGVLFLAIFSRHIWDKVDKNTVDRKRTLDNMMVDYKSANQKKVMDLLADFLFLIFLPMLYTLIGNEINFQEIELSVIGLGVIVLIIGLLFRMFTTYLSLVHTEYNYKEKIFICMSWIPKGTVQAAVSTFALEKARELNMLANIEIGNKILTLAVLRIILTAPIGTFLISFSAPRLLKVELVEENDD